MFVIFKDSVSDLSKPSFDQIQSIADSANVFVNNSVLPVVNEAAENLVVSQRSFFIFVLYSSFIIFVAIFVHNKWDKTPIKTTSLFWYFLTA